jgi:methylglyoxal synthase
MTAQPGAELKALLRMAILCNAVVACNRATADYRISSDLLDADTKPR